MWRQLQLLVTCVFQTNTGIGEWGIVPGVRAVTSLTRLLCCSLSPWSHLPAAPGDSSPLVPAQWSRSSAARLWLSQQHPLLPGAACAWCWIPNNTQGSHSQTASGTLWASACSSPGQTGALLLQTQTFIAASWQQTLSNSRWVSA